MELLYRVKDKPPFGRVIVFALQQLLSILAGTVTLPIIVGHGMSQSAALFGACVGTLLYLSITKFKSPVFLGSSFTYLGSMSAAFAGAATAAIGYVGVIIGAILGGLVYVILSIIVRFTGTNWVGKLMPPVIIGPTVAIIALTLAPGAVTNLGVGDVVVNGESANYYLCLFIGLSAFVIVVICSIFGKKTIKLIPFIFGIFSAYIIALIFTLIGRSTNNIQLMVINFDTLNNITWVPDFSFLKAFQGIKDFSNGLQNFGDYFSLIAVTYIPVAFAVFAEHIADHKNISYIIQHDLLTDPGLSRTLMGDGVGSMVGAFFGGCPNTTYGESISCVAFSKNASVITIVASCFIGIAISFIGPVMTFLRTIPTCIIGGISIALYGFIAISGFRMLKEVDLTNQKNIFVIAIIFIFGIGGMVIRIKHVEFSPVATALIAGVLVNLLVNIGSKKNKPPVIEEDDYVGNHEDDS